MWLVISYTVMLGYGFLFGIIIIIGQEFFELPEGFGLSFLNPDVLYEAGRVNWFGAYFFGILFNLIFAPFAVFYWIYKLSTVGRR